MALVYSQVWPWNGIGWPYVARESLEESASRVAPGDGGLFAVGKTLTNPSELLLRSSPQFVTDAGT